MTFESWCPTELTVLDRGKNSQGVGEGTPAPALESRWTCTPLRVLMDPQYPEACKHYFPHFQILYCLAAAPNKRNKIDFGRHCPLSALHRVGKGSVSNQQIIHTQNFITGNGMISISILMWLIVFKYHQKGFFYCSFNEKE